MPRSLIVSCVGLVVLALGAADDGSTPADVLKSKGLKRSGDVYVLGIEAEVQKAAGQARAASKAVAQIIERKRQFDQHLRDGNDAIDEILQQRIVLNRQLAQAGSAQEHNRLIGMINELGDRLTLIQKEVGDPEASQSAGTRVAMQRESFIEAVLKLRKVVDQTQEEYAGVAKDDEVKAALAGVSQAAGTDKSGKPRAAYKLGPSKAFLANVKALESVEKTVLTENVALRKKGGIYWLDVTFNGKVTRPMAFDTGASTVVLPYAMAKEVGLTPGPDAPSVKAQVADGSVTDAKKVFAPSIRVGKFVVNDVECIVMPAEKNDVPPLLGQTFQRHFMINFTPDSGKLSLTKVEPETPAASPSPAKGKGKTKAKGKR